MEHELILTGSKLNHLPSAVFRLYAILQQNYTDQYEETGDSPIVYSKDDNAYVSDSATLTPTDTAICVAYEPTGDEGHYLYEVRMKSATGRVYALTLPCGLAFLQQYYYPVRRFLRANPAKYIRPGMSRPPHEGTTLAVIDTEMQRPYITQFSGCILRYTDGAWVMDDAERMNVYIRLPEGVRMDPYVRKVTGLTREFLDANGVDEEIALDRITAFLAPVDYICGHAVLSDIELLRERYLLAGRIPDPSVLGDPAARDLTVGNLETPSDAALAHRVAGAFFGTEEEQGPDPIPACLLRSDLIDTQILMEYLYDLSGMIKLESAAVMAGVAAEGDVFHDARTDADVTARLLTRLWPEFVDRFGVSPIVKSAMMHAPKDTILLNAILGKNVSTKAEENSRTRNRTPRSRAGVKRTVRAQQRRRGR